MDAEFRKLAELLDKGVGDLGYARIDHDRGARCGFPEFVYGAGKTAAQIAGIVGELKRKGTALLCTRVSAEKASAVRVEHEDLEYCSMSQCLMLRTEVPARGFKVAVLTAGTSDLPVAYEAMHVLELCGCDCELLSDVGVAGLHRLLTKLEVLKDADAVIVVAGMEGALPSVVGGLVSCPVIAVPVSVGYGVSAGGFAALAGMLSSCASGLTVVNIDNGFGAGCAAVRMSVLKGGVAKG